VSVSGSGATRAEIVVPPATRELHASPGGGGTACSTASPCALGEAVVVAGALLLAAEA